MPAKRIVEVSVRYEREVPQIELQSYIFASNAHEGQLRRDGVTPYIRHCEDVARRVKTQWGSDAVDRIAVAYLHDVIEDTKYTKEDLLKEGFGFSETIVEAVVAITKKPKGVETYEEYLNRVKANEIARDVKIMDMISNLADDPTPQQIEKYSKGMAFLTSK